MHNPIDASFVSSNRTKSRPSPATSTSSSMRRDDPSSYEELVHGMRKSLHHYMSIAEKLADRPQRSRWRACRVNSRGVAYEASAWTRTRDPRCGSHVQQLQQA